MAQDYWIDILPPRGAYGRVGADDYVIQPHLGGPHHHHHGGRGRFRTPLPLFISPEYGESAVVVGPDDYDIPDNVAWNPFKAIAHAASSAATAAVHLGGDVVHTMNKAVESAGKAVAKIPVVGKPLKAAAVFGVSPFVAMGGFVTHMVQGDRIDRAFLASAKGQITAIRDVAPYAKFVASYIPGVGTGISAAIAAGTALADGRTITEAVLDAARNAVPGGALGKSVFDSALAIAKGNSISQVAMNAALANLPPAARDAANIAIHAAQGKNVRAGVLQAIAANIPSEAKRALEVGTALSVARNIQSHVINNINPAKLAAAAATFKVPPALTKLVPHDAGGAKGFKAALAILSHTGVNAHTLAAARGHLTAPEKAGFDHGMRTFLNVHEPSMMTLVKGGIVTRGHWRRAKKGEKATAGRLIQDGKVIHGSYVRG